MHTKHMHEMIEKLTECTKQALESGDVCVGQYPISDCVDMIKDLNEASYYASIVKAMKEAKEEEEQEEKYMLRMLKEDHKDEYKRMREQYGEEDGERRFYDHYRYANGRYAPKGRGTYHRNIRGYEEHYPPYMNDMDHMANWRDMDRHDGRMYYPDNVVRSTGTSTATGSHQPDVNPNEMNRYYSQGRTADNYAGRDYREGRSGQSRRNYMEKKELHPGNSMEDNREKMESLKEHLGDIGSDLGELVSGMGNKEKEMAVSKLDEISNSIKRTIQR